MPLNITHALLLPATHNFIYLSANHQTTLPMNPLKKKEEEEERLGWGEGCFSSLLTY
jgi:hypothetical protein